MIHHRLSRDVVRGFAWLLLGFAYACGGETQGEGDRTTAGGASGGTGGLSGTADDAGPLDGATGAGGVFPSSQCDDAPSCEGHECVAVTPGGYRACFFTPEPRTSCFDGRKPTDECCSSADCSEGQCFATREDPTCTAPAVFRNRCLTDTCTEGSCGPSAVCVPAGLLARRVAECIPAACHGDADCTASPGGACVPLLGCCNTAIGLYCAYPGTGCLYHQQCPSGQHCGVAPNGTDVACLPGPPPACAR